MFLSSTRSAEHAHTDRSDFSSLLLFVSVESFFFFAFFSFLFSRLLRRNPVDRINMNFRCFQLTWFLETISWQKVHTFFFFFFLVTDILMIIHKCMTVFSTMIRDRCRLRDATETWNKYNSAIDQSSSLNAFSFSKKILFSYYCTAYILRRTTTIAQLILNQYLRKPEIRSLNCFSNYLPKKMEIIAICLLKTSVTVISSRNTLEYELLRAIMNDNE